MELPSLPNDTILQVEVGSGAHGTGIKGVEDHDETVIFVESRNDVFGLSGGAKSQMHRSQPEGTKSGFGDTDRNVYPLRKFLQLAAAGNPSIMLCFYAPVIESVVSGDFLRDHAYAFVGRHVIPKYRGYMNSQVKHLLGFPGRHGSQRMELVESHGYDTKYAMHAARLGFQCRELLTTGKLELPIPGTDGEFLRSIRHGKVRFGDFFEAVLELDDELARLAQDESIPPTADTKTIEAVSQEIHLNAWGLTSIRY